MSKLTVHPAAAVMPPMEKHAFNMLLASISEFGLQEPIVLLDGKILDGIHRQQACDTLGIEPDYIEIELPDELSPLNYVLLHNYTRRQLTVQQRAYIASAAKDYLKFNPTDKAGEQLKRLIGEAEQPLTDFEVLTIAENHATELEPDTTRTEPPERGPRCWVPRDMKDKLKRHSTRDLVAQAFGVSEDSIKKADKVRHKGCAELVDRLKHGVMPLKDAAELADFSRDVQAGVLKEGRRAVHALLRERNDKRTQPADTTPLAPYDDLPVADRMKQWNRDIDAWCRSLLKFLDTLPEHGALLDSAAESIIEQNLRSAAATARAAKGYDLCPTCGGKGCTICNDEGFVSRVTYEAYRKDEQPKDTIPIG